MYGIILFLFFVFVFICFRVDVTVEGAPIVKPIYVGAVKRFNIVAPSSYSPELERVSLKTVAHMFNTTLEANVFETTLPNVIESLPFVRDENTIYVTVLDTYVTPTNHTEHTGGISICSRDKNSIALERIKRTGGAVNVDFISKVTHLVSDSFDLGHTTDAGKHVRRNELGNEFLTPEDIQQFKSKYFA